MVKLLENQLKEKRDKIAVYVMIYTYLFTDPRIEDTLAKRTIKLYIMQNILVKHHSISVKINDVVT